VGATAARRNVDAHAKLGAAGHGAMGVRILHVGTDSFGGYGGIALYNRELIAAMASHPSVEEVVVVPRIIVGELEPLPEKVTFVTAASRGRLAYLNALRSARGRFDLVVC